MPTAQRTQPAAVIERLLAQPQAFEFFQAVRLLRHWLGGDAAGAAPRLRFRNSLSLAFPTAEIEALAVDESVTLVPAFLGLLGAQGALPPPYTELVAARELHDRDPSARAFLDLFTHRAVTLFHAAWEKHRLHLPDAAGAPRLMPLLLALAGLGPGALRGRLAGKAGGVADEAVAYFAGAVHARVCSAAQLQGLLAGYLGVPVHVDSFVGRWYALPPQALALLGARGTLGQDAVLGERVWQRDLAVRVVLGPLDRRRHRRFLPGGAGERALRRWFGLLTGASLDVEVCLLLQRQAVQGIRLDGAPDGEAACGRLGWDSFLLTAPETRDRGDLRYGLPPPGAGPAAADLEQDDATEELTPWP